MKKIFEQPNIQVESFAAEDIMLNLSSFFSIFNDEDGEAIAD